MKRFELIISACLLCGAFTACKSQQAVETQADTVSTSAAPAEEVGEGLTEDEAQALLRDEKVLAGNAIGKNDIENELLRLQEEIAADIEGREPDFANAGVKKELKPLVAKETFTPANASTNLDYERDMAVMKLIREYIKQKKEEEAKNSAASPAAAATATDTAAK